MWRAAFAAPAAASRLRGGSGGHTMRVASRPRLHALACSGHSAAARSASVASSTVIGDVSCIPRRCASSLRGGGGSDALCAVTPHGPTQAERSRARFPRACSHAAAASTTAGTPLRVHAWTIHPTSSSTTTRSISTTRHLLAGRVYVCSDCGHESPKWMGQCSSCGEWNTLKAFSPSGPAAGKGGGRGGGGRERGSVAAARSRSWSAAGSFGAADGAGLEALPDVPEAPGVGDGRLRLPSDELNRVFGGGLVPGSVVLLTGPPGIGKSTLLLQMAAMMTQAEGGGPVAYVSGEESAQQIKRRAGRLNIDTPDLLLMNETELGTVLHEVERTAATLSGGVTALIVDSIQTMFIEDLASNAGSVTQVRESAVRLMAFAKANNVVVILVGHVTKAGELAGPRVLEHLVDVVTHMEGDSAHTHRILRTEKNRFGSTSELAVLDMGDDGLAEVGDPAQVFLSHSHAPVDGEDEDEDGYGDAARIGTAAAAVVQGTRPVCAEIQCLASESQFEYPRHRVVGLALDRLHMMLAVLARHAKVRSRSRDVFVNVVGGLRVTDPAFDLALAVAVYSALTERPVASGIAFLGEVGLGGELRQVPNVKQRVEALAKLGFTRVVVASEPRGTVTRGAPIHGRSKKWVPRDGGGSGGGGSGDGVSDRSDVSVVYARSLRHALRLACPAKKSE